ncbi:MAG: metallophosphoesterase [Clostridia bacterium]|nr:metallophosphoesterase [Clostridia bacterium]
MAIYAISDLHLSFGENKPMDVFGVNWEKHTEKIRENWLSKVTENDLVLLPGDFSWATYLKDTYMDFQYLSSMPGKKILLKGNHDYWWTSLKKMREYLEENNFKNIDFLHNNSYEFENKIIVGTRGWQDENTKEDKNIIKREILRLELSIQDGIKKYGKEKEIIVCMHYPPFNRFEEIEFSFINVMKKYNITKCIYGHLHGENSHKEAKEGLIEEIEFKLVSCDYTKFNLIKI